MWKSVLRDLVSKAWILSSESASRVHLSQPQRGMKVTRDLYDLNLPADGVAPPDLVSSAIAAIVMKSTTAESDPDAKLLTQQTFCVSSVDVLPSCQ